MTIKSIIQDERHSVIKQPDDIMGGSIQEIILNFATAADEFPAWGTQPARRDMLLRNFWPSEPILASAMTNMVAKYASLGWRLEGPPKTVKQTQLQLQYVEHGEGMAALRSKIALDLFSQDNGAFMEVVRTHDSPDAIWVSLNHLDSGRCIRTGRREEPVIYYDKDEKPHKLKWYQVICMSEMPSPIERMRGMQYCAVTRLLRAAQIMKDISIYEQEKISGRFVRAIHFISGVTQRAVRDALNQSNEDANNQRLLHYMEPIIIATLDPTSQVTKQTIEMATLPDHFDKEVFMRWYINQLALAFATDYQEFAPLPAGNLGTSQQSQILHLKSKGKGPALFMTMFERALNFHNVLPATVHFAFGEQDTDVDIQKAELKATRAATRAARIASGEITPEIARQEAVDDGDLKPEYVAAIGEPDVTPEQHVSDGGIVEHEHEPAAQLPKPVQPTVQAPNNATEKAASKTWTVVERDNLGRALTWKEESV